MHERRKADRNDKSTYDKTQGQSMTGHQKGRKKASEDSDDLRAQIGSWDEARAAARRAQSRSMIDGPSGDDFRHSHSLCVVEFAPRRWSETGDYSSS